MMTKPPKNKYDKTKPRAKPKKGNQRTNSLLDNSDSDYDSTTNKILRIARMPKQY